MDKGFFILLFLTPLATRSIVAFVNSDLDRPRATLVDTRPSLRNSS